MRLTSSQKRYIKRNIKSHPIDVISQHLNVEPNEILRFLKNRWGADKLHNFLSPMNSSARQEDANSHLLTWFKTNCPFLIGLMILILITYTNSINNNFLSDDLAEIKNNPQIQTLQLTLSHPMGFLRPFLYYLTYHLAGLAPFAFRSINFIFHIGSTVLLFTIVQLLYGSSAAIIAASLFAVHPALEEAVVWISGGAYVQYSFFYLLSILFYLLFQRQNLKSRSARFYFLSVVSFFFSLESQQIAITLPIILLVYEIVFGNLKRNWLSVLPFFLISSVWVFFSLSSIPERVHTLQTVHYQQKTLQNPFTIIPIAISSYLELLSFPKVLTLYHSELNFDFLNFLIRSFLTLTIFIITIYSFLKNKKIFFWLVFFIINLLPTIITATFGLTWIVAERYLYLSSIGMFVIVGITGSYLLKRGINKVAFTLLIILIIIALSSRTIIRNIDWTNEDKLWIATGKTSPSSPNTHNNLGDVYGRHGDKQGALKEFQTAILLKPNYADAFHNLANTYHELKDEQKALENYQKAVEINPYLWQSYQNIAAIYYEQGKLNLALDNINKAIQLNPQNPYLVLNLGIIYYTKGDKTKAKEWFTKTLTIDPNNERAKSALTQLSTK